MKIQFKTIVSNNVEYVLITTEDGNLRIPVQDFAKFAVDLTAYGEEHLKHTTYMNDYLALLLNEVNTKFSRIMDA